MPATELDDARRDGRAPTSAYHVRKNGTAVLLQRRDDAARRRRPRFAKIARDLTAQQQAAEALQDAHDELESASGAHRRVRGEVAKHEAASQP